MAVRGSNPKTKLTKALLQIFQGSFLDGKTVRIPIYDNDFSEVVEIKISMTAAKDILGGTSVYSGGIIKDVEKFNEDGPTKDELAELAALLNDLLGDEVCLY